MNKDLQRAGVKPYSPVRLVAPFLLTITTVGASHVVWRAHRTMAKPAADTLVEEAGDHYAEEAVDDRLPSPR